jgi:hypothetical protein
MFRGKEWGRRLAVIAVLAIGVSGVLGVETASAASPGIDPSYGEGGILRTESQVPSGYTGELRGGQALAGTNGSALYLSGLTTCAGAPEASGCRIPATLRRFTPSGSLDGTYGEGGVLKLGYRTPGPYPVAATDARGRLFVAEGDGDSISVRRFTARGKADPRYGASALASLGSFGTQARPVAMLMAPDEDLVVAIAEPTEAGFTPASERVTLVRGFGRAGRAVVGVTSAFGTSVYETPKGATLVVGRNCCGVADFTPVLRVSAAGKVDVHFNAKERRSQVKALASFSSPLVVSVVPHPDGTIDLFGSSQAASDPGGPGYALRLKADGSLERRFGENGMVTLGPGILGAEAGSGGTSLLSFRSLAAPGEARAHFERLLADGRPDPRFGGEAGIAVPEPGGEAELIPSAGGKALALVDGNTNCQVRCEPSPYLVRLIEPSGKSGTGKGGKH